MGRLSSGHIFKDIDNAYLLKIPSTYTLVFGLTEKHKSIVMSIITLEEKVVKSTLPQLVTLTTIHEDKPDAGEIGFNSNSI